MSEYIDHGDGTGSWINITGGLTPKVPAVPERALILRDAEKAVCSDRNTEYGEPIDNFSRWAGMCNAAGYRGPDGRLLKPHDLAIIAGLGKFSRAMETPKKRDHGVDVAGYGSLMTELALLEDQ